MTFGAWGDDMRHRRVSGPTFHDNDGRNHISHLFESPPLNHVPNNSFNAPESSPEDNIYGPSPDENQLSRDAPLDMINMMGPANFHRLSQQMDMQDDGPHDFPGMQMRDDSDFTHSSWNSGEMHGHFRHQNSQQLVTPNGYITSPTDYVVRMHQPEMSQGHYYTRDFRRNMQRHGYQQQASHHSQYPYACVENYNADVENYNADCETTSDEMEEEEVEQFEIEGINWDPRFNVKQHKTYLETLERLWTRLVPNTPKIQMEEDKKDQQSEDVDKMEVSIPEKVEALDPQSVITAFLYGKPVGEDFMIRVLQLFREKGAQLSMVTNKLGYDICHVIIQSADLLVQSLLPFLIHCGYNIYSNKIPKQKTLLHIAWQCQNRFAFYTLLKAGADPNECYGIQKQTILHHMLQMLFSVVNFSDMDDLSTNYIGVLLNLGANITIANASGLTCADYIDNRLMRLLKSKLRECNNERKKALEVLRKHVPNEAPKNICSFVPRLTVEKRAPKCDAPKLQKTTLRLIKKLEHGFYSHHSDQDL